MPKLLTVRKQAWMASNQVDAIRGHALEYPAGVYDRYGRALAVLVKQMTAQTAREVKKYLAAENVQRYFAQDAGPTAAADKIMEALSKKFLDLFDSKAEQMANEMLAQSNDASASAVSSSIKQIAPTITLNPAAVSMPLKEVLKASVKENVALIKSIPVQYLNSVRGTLMRAITAGDLSSLVPALLKSEEVTIRRARMIAKDQVRKSFTALNRERMIKVGLDEYEWLHVPSNAPRPLHVSYDGQVFKLSEPPIIDEKTGERGIPGQAINCHCRMRPIVRIGSKS